MVDATTLVAVLAAPAFLGFAMLPILGAFVASLTDHAVAGGAMRLKG